VDVTSRSEDGGHAGFSIGPFDLYITSRFSAHWSALGELVFENDDNTVTTDLERLLIAWQASDALRVRAGREHNPLVRWNTVLHHGDYMQTPSTRCFRPRTIPARRRASSPPWSSSTHAASRCTGKT
jgi:hypothetical protein